MKKSRKQTIFLNTLILLCLSAVILAGCSDPERFFDQHFQSAKEYIESNQYPEARIELINALKYKPGDRDSSLVLVKVLTRLGEYRGAISVCRGYLEDHPDDRDFTIQLGHSLLKIGDHQGVLDLFDNPGIADPDYLMILSRSLVRTGEPGRAASLARQAVENGPGRIDLMSNEFQILLGMDEITQARVVLERMNEADPENDLVLISRINYLHATGDSEGAVRIFDAILERHPDNPSYLLQYVDYLETLGRMDAAVGLLEDFLKRNEHAVATARYGQLMKKTGNAAVAEATWNRALELNPRLLQPKLDLTRLYLETGRTDEALNLVESSLREQPGNPIMLALKGEINFRNREYAEAAHSLVQALKTVPMRNDWKVLLARAWIASGDRASARQVLSEILAVQENHAEARVLFAGLDLAFGSAENAAVHAYAASRDGTYGREAMWILGDAALKTRGLEAALDIHRRSEKRYGSHPETTMRIAWIMERMGRTDEAASLFRDVLNEKPGDMKALVSLVRLLLNHGDPSGALEAARKYGDGDSPERNLFLAQVLEITEKMSEAENVYRSILENNPGYTPVYSRYVRFLAKQGRLDTAERLLKQQLAEDDKRSALWTLLGTVYDFSDRRSEAIAAYQKALERDPYFVPVLNNLAWDLAEAGQLDEALKHAGEAVRLSPDNGYARDTYGWILHLMGDSQSAVLELREAVRLLPDHEEVNDHFRQVLVALGRENEIAGNSDGAGGKKKGGQKK